MPKHSPWEGPRNISGPRIRQARERLDMSQEELAAKLQLHGIDVDRRTVGNKELGVVPVYDYELLAFASILQVSPNWLLGEE